MNEPDSPSRVRRWPLPVTVLAGVAALVALILGRDPPARAPAAEVPRPVRVIEAPAVNVLPRAVGYGSVRPGRVWEAVAEVGGKVVEIHPELKVGATLRAGTALLRIDPTDYELAIARAETEIAAIDAQRGELDLREQNTEASLAIEESALALGRRELERKRRLAGQGTLPRADADAEERAFLGQRQQVQSLRNSLSLMPAERRVLDSQRASLVSQLEQVRRDLARTRIELPFDARIATLAVQRDQSVRPGDRLLGADGIAVAEVEAQVPIHQMRPLVPRLRDNLPAEALFSAGQTLLDLEVAVRLPAIGVQWPARLSRLSPTIDPGTQTVGVIVEVDEPYRNARPGERPPLFKGLFVAVELTGAARPNRVVVPRGALRGDRVYLVDGDRRLEIRAVDVEIQQPEYVVLGAGVAPGEAVVLGELVPAIEGMLLAPVPDPDTLDRLVTRASGRTP